MNTISQAWPDLLRPAEPRITYDRPPAHFASQFLLTAGEDHLVLECSAGVIADGDSGLPLMPVHTRLAMPWLAARRLHAVLAQALNQHERLTPASSLETAKRAASLDRQSSQMHQPNIEV